MMDKSILDTTMFRIAGFAGAAILVLAASFWIVTTPEFVGHGKLLSLAVTIDITLFLPFLYFLAIRKTSVRKFSVIPIFFLATIGASLILPSNQQAFLDLIRYLLIPGEFFLIGWVLYKVHRILQARKRARKSGIDFIESLRNILMDSLQSPLAANILSTEIAVFHYAVNGWRSNREVDGPFAFSYHKKSQYSIIVSVFSFLILMESFAVHLALSSWNQTLAWIISLLSLYSVFFLLGDLNAAKRRPVSLDENYLYLRTGIRWFSRIPLSDIEKISTVFAPLNSRDHANMVLMGSPNLLLYFSSEQTAIGLYGFSKRFLSVSIALDDREEFQRILEAKLVDGSARDV